MRYLFGLALLIAPAACWAQTADPAAPIGPSAQGDVAVTIYQNGNALVQDTRRLSLPAGVSRQEFPDVADGIRPATVRLSAAGTEVVEQNYDYDLLTPGALIEKAVGQTVTLVRTNPATGAQTRETAKVLAANDGVVLQVGDHLEVLRDDGLPTRVLFASIPPGLRARPTLSVTLDAKSGGPRPVTLSYLTNNLSWSADYVALFDEGKATVDVQGWITLGNRGQVPFANADVVLVAGNPNARGGYRPSRGIAPGTLPGTESAPRARLGDYYLYPLGHRTTIAANQTKQVSFLSAGGVPARRVYRYANAWLGAPDDPESAASVIAFSTGRGDGLGDALPAGTVRVYLRDAKGQPQFIGEAPIGHTPMGSTLALKTGDAFDVKVKPVVESRTRKSSDRWTTAMRYTLTNARPEPVTVELVQAGLDGADTRIASESQPSERRSADEAVWQVSVPANGSTTVTATFDTRF